MIDIDTNVTNTPNDPSSPTAESNVQSAATALSAVGCSEWLGDFVRRLSSKLSFFRMDDAWKPSFRWRLLKLQFRILDLKLSNTFLKFYIFRLQVRNSFLRFQQQYL